MKDVMTFKTQRSQDNLTTILDMCAEEPATRMEMRVVLGMTSESISRYLRYLKQQKKVKVIQYRKMANANGSEAVYALASCSAVEVMDREARRAERLKRVDAEDIELLPVQRKSKEKVKCQRCEFERLWFGEVDKVREGVVRFFSLNLLTA